MAEEQKHNIMTAESLKKLQERYDYLLNVKRKEIINAIEIARGFGDLSENAEYGKRATIRRRTKRKSPLRR